MVCFQWVTEAEGRERSPNDLILIGAEEEMDGIGEENSSYS